MSTAHPSTKMAARTRHVHILMGEVNVLHAAMKRAQKWNSQEDRNQLLEKVLTLKHILSNCEDLDQIDAKTFLLPFLDIIRAPDTSVVVTTLALTTVQKILSYRILDHRSKAEIASVVEQISESVTHAQFTGSDPASDEGVMMKIFDVLKTLVTSPPGNLLTNESVCDIAWLLFNVSLVPTFSGLLRNISDTFLIEIIHHLFTRLPELAEGTKITRRTMKKLRHHVLKRRAPSPPPKAPASAAEPGPNSESPVGDPVADAASSALPGSTDLPPASVPDRGLDGLTTDTVSLLDSSMQTQSAIVNAESHDIAAVSEKGASTSVPESTMTSNTDLAASTPTTVSWSMAEPVVSSSGEEESAEETEPDGSKASRENEAKENREEFVNERGVKFRTALPKNDETGAYIPYGLPAIHEILRHVVTFMLSTEKSERKNDTDGELSLNLGLKILGTALETSAPIIPRYATLMVLIRDELCKNFCFLLQNDRLSIFSLTLRLAFFVFDSMRDNLKLQMEHFLNILLDIVSTESPRFTFEHKEAALDFVLRLWRLPGFVAELYLNYDCDVYCSNLFEDSIKVLSKSAFPVMGITPVHILSLECLLMAVDRIDRNCQKALQGIESAKSELPPAEHANLLRLKLKKKLLSNGTELFNQKPGKGVECLQEHGLLGDPLQPAEVVRFLRENHRLDKAMIGDYISNRKNTKVLEAFVKSFDFAGKRIDEALREYLEAFRLPGESPLISHLMEHFAAHWQQTSGTAFQSQDSAFIVSYAVIMLNTAFHNEIAKKQSTPMSLKDFQKQLSKQNKRQGESNGDDFEPALLEQIYNSIKKEEIVMPAEQKGRVKELYLWKMLLRRSAKSPYCSTPIAAFDRELFALLWGPSVSALSHIFDKTADDSVIRKTIGGFKKCASISASPRILSCEIFDNIIATLCKYSTLQNHIEPISLLPVSFGQNTKAQLATKTVFILAHQHGDVLREGWKNLVECIVQLFRARLLPEHFNAADDFGLQKSVSLLRDEPALPKQEGGFLNSLYNFIAFDSNSRMTTQQEESELKNIARACVDECQVGDLIFDSKFLQNESLRCFVDALIATGRSRQKPQEPASPVAEKPAVAPVFEEQSAIICLEMLVKVLVENRDRLGEQGVRLWPVVHDYFFTTLLQESRAEMSFLTERAAVGLLRLAVRFLPRDHDRELQQGILQSLRLLQGIRLEFFMRLSRQISFALHDLFQTNAPATIRNPEDWKFLFSLLECAGAGLRLSGSVSTIKDKELTKSESQQLTRVQSDAEADRGYTSDSELYENQSISPAGSNTWLMVGKEGEVVEAGSVNDRDMLLFPFEFCYHDKEAFFKAVASLEFLIRATGQITPANVPALVHCLCVFAEASVNGSPGINGRIQRAALKRAVDKRIQQKIQAERRNAALGKGKAASTPTSPPDEEGSDYLKESQLVLELMHIVHVRVGSICQAARSDLHLWTEVWFPLLRGIARVCCDSRRTVRMDGLTWLNRALLIPDLQSLTAQQWEDCIHKVLFPLLCALRRDTKLHQSMEDTIVRAAPLVCKVFLQHLTALITLPSFPDLWMSVLDHLDQFLKSDTKSDLVKEAVLESIKNMLLVMSTAGVFQEYQNALWDQTRLKVETIVPGLIQQLLEITTSPPVERIPPARTMSPDPPTPVTFLAMAGEPNTPAEPAGTPLLLDPGILEAYNIPRLPSMSEGNKGSNEETRLAQSL